MLWWWRVRAEAAEAVERRWVFVTRRLAHALSVVALVVLVRQPPPVEYYHPPAPPQVWGSVPPHRPLNTDTTPGLVRVHQPGVNPTTTSREGQGWRGIVLA
jgi:hypothetical protein